MKKALFVLLTIGLALFLGACNSNVESLPGGPSGGGGEDVVYNWGSPGAKLNLKEDTGNYPGRSLELSKCPDIKGKIGDISLYGEIVLFAKLYDEDENEITAKDNGLAQFSILTAGNTDWNDKLVDTPNLKSQTDLSGSPITGKKGTPGILVVQGSYKQDEYAKGKVVFIEVQKLTFKPKTSDVTLDTTYDNGSFIAVAGNKITFKNAMYKDAAAQYVFPTDWTTSYLTGKTLNISFRIEGHDSHLVQQSPSDNSGGATESKTEAEHQIHIQAANSNKNDYNGENPGSSNGNVGQKYITLDSTKDTGWTDESKSGTIKVPLNDLIAAANKNSNSSGSSPFTFNAIRIVNNGTIWNESKDGETIKHIRCRSYTLVINSVSVK